MEYLIDTHVLICAVHVWVRWKISRLIHKDPFDRLLVTQARHGDMALVTSDGLVSQYDVEVIW